MIFDDTLILDDGQARGGSWPWRKATHRSEIATEIQAPWLIRRIQTPRCRHRKKDTQHKDLSSAPTTGALCGTPPPPLLSLLVGFPLYLSSPSINFRFSFSIYIYIYIYIFEHDQHTASHHSVLFPLLSPPLISTNFQDYYLQIKRVEKTKKNRRPSKKENIFHCFGSNLGEVTFWKRGKVTEEKKVIRKGGVEVLTNEILSLWIMIIQTKTTSPCSWVSDPYVEKHWKRVRIYIYLWAGKNKRKKTITIIRSKKRNLLDCTLHPHYSTNNIKEKERREAWTISDKNSHINNNNN